MSALAIWGIVLGSIYTYLVIGLFTGRWAYKDSLRGYEKHPEDVGYGKTPEAEARGWAWFGLFCWPICGVLMGIYGLCVVLERPTKAIGRFVIRLVTGESA